MYKDKKILAIIPARGGSKGLPGKNVKPLLGKPLIGWTIEQALTSKYIDEIFVSTDSREIADVAETFGVQVPDLRPEELANDTASSMDFILYTLHLLEKRGKNFSYIVLLEPTSPLRDVMDIDYAIEQYKKQVTKVRNHKAYMLTVLYQAKAQSDLDISNQVMYDFYGAGQMEEVGGDDNGEEERMYSGPDSASYG